MEEVLSLDGPLPESAVPAMSPWPSAHDADAPSLPPLALGAARIARVALRRLSTDVAQSLTLISQRGIDCLITIDSGADRSIANASTQTSARGNAAQGWRLSLSEGVAQPLRDACDREAVLDWSGARMRLLYRNAAALSWLAARLNIDSDMPLDDVSAQSLRGAAFGDVIARLALTGLGVPHIVSDSPLSDAARADTRGESADFSFVVLLQALNSTKLTILAVLEADAFGVNVLAALLQHRPERPRVDTSAPTPPSWGAIDEGGREPIGRPPQRFGLQTIVRIVLPSVRLPIADVQALSVGDVVLLEVPRTPVGRATLGAGAHPISDAATVDPTDMPVPAADGWRDVDTVERPDDVLPGYLEVGGRVCWRVVVRSGTAAEGSGYVRLIDRELGVVDDGMDDVNDGADDTNGTNRFAARADGRDGDGGDGGAGWSDRVPVRVTFELGTKTVPLAELQRWREGTVLPFHLRSTSPTAIDTSTEDGTVSDDSPTVTVRIRINGAPLGIGELVDIDGRLGVSIVTLFAGGAGAMREANDEAGDETDADMRGVQGAALP
jgi:hypothetical protein